MAYCQEHDLESIIRIYDVPQNLLLGKLKHKLENLGYVGISDLKWHGSYVEARVDDVDALKTLPGKLKVTFGSQKIELKIVTSSQSDVDTADSTDETFHYPVDSTEMKAIFRYLDHQRNLKDELIRKVAHLGKVTINPKESIDIEKRSKMEIKQWNKTCKTCVEEFLNLFTSWSEQLDDVSDPVTEKYMKSLRNKYEDECFVNWYQDSSTILVTGKQQDVEKVKNDVENRLCRHSPQRVSQSGIAHTFMYDSPEPAILRFVLRHKQLYKPHLDCDLQEIAETTFMQSEKIVQVQVKPVRSSIRWTHDKFEMTCEEKLKKFFSRFETVKYDYDIDKIQHIQSKNPKLPELKDKNLSDLFVQWFVDSGRVNITGVKLKVEKQKRCIEKIMGLPNNLSSLPASPRKQSFPFTESVPPAVLKFIYKNTNCKSQLKYCCGSYAKVFIFNEEGSIRIEISLNKEKTGPDIDKHCIESVKKYLGNFSSENLNFDEKRLTRACERNVNVFSVGDSSERIFIQPFPKVVKVTGFKDEVDERVAIIKHEVECDVEEEILPVHVFIVQRECEVWKKVKHAVCTVTITPVEEEHKIVYKGTPDDIIKAKQKLGAISEDLHEGPVTGLNTRQKEYITSCLEFQEKAKTRDENKLEWLYALFREKSLHGALVSKDGVILLLSENKQKWSRCIRILQQNILEKQIPVSGITKKIMERIHNNIADNTEMSVLVKNLSSDHISVVGNCKNNDQLVKIVQDALEEQDLVKRKYKMPSEKAKHIKRFCKIEQTKNFKISVDELLVTCAKEDIDLVDMWHEDLQIVTDSKTFCGYSIHEHFSGKGRDFLSVVENETKSSFFLQPDFGTPAKVKKKTPVVSVVVSNILEEKCDAIVMSTGPEVGFSGQVGKSLLQKFGAGVQTLFSQNYDWVIPNKLHLVFDCQHILPWKFIFSLVISSHSLKKDLIDLFTKAEKLKIKSLALPTIGAGNLGLTGNTVASKMQRALEEFKQQNPTHLLSIKVVVFNSNLMNDFLPLASKPEPNKSTPDKSHGMCATVYSSDKETLEQALKKLQETIEQHVKTVTLNNKPMKRFSDGIKDKIEKCCLAVDVLLTWSCDGSFEHCKLEGIVDNVRKAEDEVKEILRNDSNLPFEWTAMPVGKTYYRVTLQEHSKEYKKVKDRFKDSKPSFSKIVQIERIQNPFLYKQFRDRSDYVQNLPGNSTRDIVKQLFHGTNGNKVEKICRVGFDRAFAGENGTVYGKGVNFAVNSSYSASFAKASLENLRYMFLANVVTGEYEFGKSEYKDAPINPRTGLQYDSVVNNVANPEIFVIFRDTSVYPSYLITFV